MTWRLLATAALAAGVAAGLMLTSGSADAQERVRWKLASTYSGSLTQLGTLGKRITEEIEKVSGGSNRMRFNEPGALVPALEVFDAVSAGSVDVAWSTAGYWAGKIPAAPLFSAVPFGPRAGEYLAWFEFAGGKELFKEDYSGFGIEPVLCGIIAPEASGWFKNEITSVEDLRGLKMRFFGLGAQVMEKMGVSTQLIAGGDIYPALELGSIDATEFSMPAIDLNLGFYQVAKHYYFPGWHQQSTTFELLINQEKWDALDETQQAQINAVCGDSIRYGLAEGEAIQFAALEELQEKGVTVHQWPDEILEQLEAAWLEVGEEQKADEDFARVWESLSSFRDGYQTWEEIGYLK
ncbi:MAG: TRAP transporter substrate-binding protein [Geminicoccaceae bacterium]